MSRGLRRIRGVDGVVVGIDSSDSAGTEYL